MIDLRALGEDIVAAAVEALGDSAQLVAERARARAPVRNIFGVRYGFRGKSIEEAAQSRAALGGRVGSMAVWNIADRPRTKLARGLRRKWRDRRMSAADLHLAAYDEDMVLRRHGLPYKTVLSPRGAYEVRTKRAKFRTFGHSGIGGRLRGEITATRPVIAGKSAEAWVISPTRYARYMEYGSRHNRAHPYLRPAAEESRQEVRNLIAAAVSEASRTGGSKAVINIRVRL